MQHGGREGKGEPGENRFEQGGHGGFADPAQPQAGHCYAQLYGGEVGVYVRHLLFRQLGGFQPVGGQLLKAGKAHFDQREFHDDEDPVKGYEQGGYNKVEEINHMDILQYYAGAYQRRGAAPLKYVLARRAL